MFALASLALSLDPFIGAPGALWLIGGRIVQAVGGSMLTANSAAILTDAFPARQRGMALGVNQIAGLAGQFLGLLAGGLLATATGAQSSGSTCRSASSARSGPTAACARPVSAPRPRIDWVGNITFTAGTVAVLVAVTNGIQPYDGHATGWSNPHVLMGSWPGLCRWSPFASSRPAWPIRCSGSACSASVHSPPVSSPR